MRAFSVDRELGSANVISWNHQEFEVCVFCVWIFMGRNKRPYKIDFKIFFVLY